MLPNYYLGDFLSQLVVMTWHWLMIQTQKILHVLDIYIGIEFFDIWLTLWHIWDISKTFPTKNSTTYSVRIYVFSGCTFFMASFNGVSDLRDWWSSYPIDWFKGDPFCWNDYLSYFSFEDIAQGLHVTKLPNPPHTDQFHDVWKMIYEFNQYYMVN